MTAALPVLVFSSILVTKNITHADNTNTNYKVQVSKYLDEKENVAIKTALHDYVSLEVFHKRFYTTGDTEIAIRQMNNG